jgi:hypothetical protein
MTAASAPDARPSPPAPTARPDVPADRRDRPERRGPDRRAQDVPVAVERRAGGDRRAGTDRRDPTKRAGTYDLDPETLEFIEAINRFKADSGKPFPTWSEVFAIVRALGYSRPT